MHSLVRRCILQHLIWVYTVWQCPFYGTLGVNGSIFSLHTSNITQNQAVWPTSSWTYKQILSFKSSPFWEGEVNTLIVRVISLKGVSIHLNVSACMEHICANLYRPQNIMTSIFFIWNVPFSITYWTLYHISDSSSELSDAQFWNK